ncbi:hypothetical protein C8R43DRAFT_17476 [Mycena crocata]|nr:hypothetical protein C8R43DRAFT_17476 [Mycena crocata]
MGWDADTTPILPPEIEREIFETAAYKHPQTIPLLLLICHRVHEWVEIVKYSTVTSSGVGPSCAAAALLRAIRSPSKHASFFGTRVRNFLYMETINWMDTPPLTDDDLRDLLSSCSGLQSLVLMAPIEPALLPSLEALRPRRMSIYLKTLRTDCAMFAFVTHLDLFDNINETDFNPGPNLALVPGLTHLSLFQLNDPLVAVNLLQQCKRLQVLIGMYSHSLPERKFGGPGPATDDPRLLSILMTDKDYEEDWFVGTRDGMDFWARADAFVAKKRRGEIKPGFRCWIEKADGIELITAAKT